MVIWITAAGRWKGLGEEWKRVSCGEFEIRCCSEDDGCGNWELSERKIRKGNKFGTVSTLPMPAKILQAYAGVEVAFTATGLWEQRFPSLAAFGKGSIDSSSLELHKCTDHFGLYMLYIFLFLKSYLLYRIQIVLRWGMFFFVPVYEQQSSSHRVKAGAPNNLLNTLTERGWYRTGTGLRWIGQVRAVSGCVTAWPCVSHKKGFSWSCLVL